MTQPTKTTLTLEVEVADDGVTIYCPELRCMSDGATFEESLSDFRREATERAQWRAQMDAPPDGPSLNATARAALATARRIGMAAAKGDG